MKVGIDASRYGHSESTGVEWYCYHLFNELIPLLGREHNSEIRLYSPTNFEPQVELPFNVKKIIIPMRRLWTVIRLSLEMIFKPVDILFVPAHTLPLVFPKKSIITIHDVAFKYLKNSYTKFQFWQLNSSTKKAVKKAWRIIVPSQATKKDLIELFKCDPEKIYIVPHGAPYIQPILKWSEDEQKAMFKHCRITENDLYALYVGRLESKKNLVRLVEAFDRFIKEFPDWKLVLAGKRGVGFDEIWKKVLELDLDKNVIMPGYITENEKLFLMYRCRMVVLPSLYEGFGLPILEGFAMRRPVLSSRVSAIPEVAGNAAYLVNPEKVEELSVGLKRLAADGMLVSQLILKGDKQLKNFSWEKAAKQTYEVLFGT